MSKAKGTLTQLFFETMTGYADRLPCAYRAKVGGTWQAITHRDAERRARHLALGLRELGIQAGDRVAILSETRVEWALADFACLCAQAVDVPIYPTLTAKQIEYILSDSGSVGVFCSTAEQVAKVIEVKARLPALKHVMAFESTAARPGVTLLGDLEAKGKAAEGRYPRFKEDALAVSPDALATLIYTSGTTGDPKGVMLTHNNIWSNVQAVLQVLDLGDAEECLAMLPLSHIFERMVDYTLMQAGVIINYAESFDKVAANLGEVHPTIVVSVPRLYEKVYARVLENALSGSAIKRKIFFWAKGVGEQWANHRLAGVSIPPWLAFRRGIADRLVFAKLRARTGGRIRFFVSGSAPLSAEIAKFFYSASLPIIEGYGLTETSPACAVNLQHALRIGTVGRPLPGVTIRIADDAEILIKGDHVFRGYWSNDAATAEAIDADGWFHSGDLGELDDDGYLRITGRKKELIVTAGGKNVSPAVLEERLRAHPLVSQCMVVGDRKPFIAALVTLDEDALSAWKEQHGKPADATVADLRDDDQLRVEIQQAVDEANLAVSKAEAIKVFRVLPRDFTEATGEMTPSMKVKRNVVAKQYADEIAAIYRG